MISPLRRTPLINSTRDPERVPHLPRWSASGRARRSPRVHLAGALALLAAAALPGRARAQARVVDFPSPTSSLYVPGGVIAGDADATAVALNPGQLGLVEMASTAVLASLWNEDVAYEGRGVGALMTSPLVINGLTMGAGLEWLLPSDAEQTDDYFKLSLGGGLRLGRGLGFGAVVAAPVPLALRRAGRPEPGAGLAAGLVPGRRPGGARRAAAPPGRRSGPGCRASGTPRSRCDPPAAPGWNWRSARACWRATTTPASCPTAG